MEGVGRSYARCGVKCSSFLLRRSSGAWDQTDIRTVTTRLCFPADVLDSMARFSVQGVFNYSMLTLSDHERVLYIGAREALFALDPNDISRQLRPQVRDVRRRAPASCCL